MLSAQAAGQGAGTQPSGFGGTKYSMMAGSPFTDYTAGVVEYVLIIGFLVATLLIGGLLVVNLGLMSKREEDQIGGRTPSDVGLLKNTRFPHEEEPEAILPAEDGGQCDDSIVAQFASKQPPSHNVSTHVDLASERVKREEWRKIEADAERREDEQRDADWEEGELERRGRTERPPHEPDKAA
jgi:hypothetical protein